MKKIINIFTIALGLTIFTACENEQLNIKNTNNPDFIKVYSSGDDLESLASSLYNKIFTGSNSAGSVKPMLATASDNISCSWGNFAMRDMSWEPRNNAWNNSPSYSYQANSKKMFDDMYGAINTANNILKAIESGTNIGPNGERNQRTIAMCRFAQGVAYGNLALVFDKAFLVDEKVSVDSKVSAASSYKEIATAAIKYLDQAIATSSANSFTIPSTWLGVEADFSNQQLKELASTYAARFLAYTPRNKAELAAVDWNKVKTYADGGIKKDFNIMEDGYVNWYDEAGDYLTYNGWGVTDMYVVNLMDPTMPKHWDDKASFPHPPASTSPIDKRINSDFQYVGSNWFQAARGYYHYSNYRHSRYDEFYVNAMGPKPEIMLSENDMLRAEARVYSNSPNLAEAAEIINSGTRVKRGGMSSVGANKDELIQAIHHERHVEMVVTGFGLQFFEMRKLNLLQKGTPLHLPLPAKTLETFGEKLPYYTFGTESKADGINTSNGGWR